jgi:hypothetical protein
LGFYERNGKCALLNLLNIRNDGCQGTHIIHYGQKLIRGVDNSLFGLGFVVELSEEWVHSLV